MTTAIKRRRGTTSEHSTFTGLAGEITIDTTKDTVVVHDGSTAGGFPLAKENNPTFTGNIESDSVTIGVGAVASTEKLRVNGTVLTLGGSVSTPAIGIGDVNTGVYAPTAGKLGWTVNGNQRLLLDSTGIDVTGAVTANGLTVDGNARIQNTGNSYNTISLNANRTAAVNTLGRLDYEWDGNEVVRLQATSGSDTTNKDNGFFTIFTSDDGTLDQRLKIDSNGDISFYEDTGTTAKLFWDASAEALGLGTSSPSAPLSVVGTIPTQIPALGAASSHAAIGGSGFGTMIGTKNTGVGYIQQQRFDGGLTAYSLLLQPNGGKVGIGTSSVSTDADKLHVDSSSTNSVLIEGIGTKKLFSYHDSGGTGWATGAGSGFTNLIYLKDTDNSIRLLTNGSEAMGIDSSGNVTLGAGGTYRLDINAPTSSAAKITCDNTSMEIGTFDNHVVKFLQNNTERMRLDSSANLLVGTTSDNVANQTGTTQGVRIAGGSVKNIQVASTGTTAYFNRLTTDGSIAEFRKDGATVGSIGTASGYPYWAAPANFSLMLVTNDIRPRSVTGSGNNDNSVDIGTSAARFKDIYLGGGVYLGGTGAANKLDDYEEGTFTPVLDGVSGWSGSSGVIGKYTKIGNTVHIFIAMTSNVALTGTATNRITGLPFSNDTFERSSNVSISRMYGINLTTTDYIAGVAGTELFFSYVNGDNNVNNFTSGGSTLRLTVSATYLTA